MDSLSDDEPMPPLEKVESDYDMNLFISSDSSRGKVNTRKRKQPDVQRQRVPESTRKRVPQKSTRKRKRYVKPIPTDSSDFNPDCYHDRLSFVSTLLPFQDYQVDRCHELGGRVLIAAEMGMGKTLISLAEKASYYHNFCQSIAWEVMPLLSSYMPSFDFTTIQLIFAYGFDLCEYDDWPHRPLVIITKPIGCVQFIDDLCKHTTLPREVIRVWTTFTRKRVTWQRSNATSYTAQETQLMLDAAWHQPYRPWIECLTHSMATRHAAWLKQQNIQCFTLDESHVMKGPDTKITTKLSPILLASSRLAFLSGTPMNRPFDLYAQLRVLRPDLFSDVVQYVSLYCSNTGQAEYKLNRFSRKNELVTNGTNKKNMAKLFQLLHDTCMVDVTRENSTQFQPRPGHAPVNQCDVIVPIAHQSLYNRIVRKVRREEVHPSNVFLRSKPVTFGPFSPASRTVSSSTSSTSSTVSTSRMSDFSASTVSTSRMSNSLVFPVVSPSISPIVLPTASAPLSTRFMTVWTTVEASPHYVNQYDSFALRIQCVMPFECSIMDEIVFYLIGDEVTERRHDLRASMEKLRDLAKNDAELLGSMMIQAQNNKSNKKSSHEQVFLHNVTKTDLYRIPSGIRFLQWLVKTKMTAPGCETNKVAIFTSRHIVMDAAYACMDEALRKYDTFHKDSDIARVILIRSGVPNNKRQQLVDCIRTESACRAAVLGFVSGGASIELSQCNMVVCWGLCANASDYLQALARVVGRLSQLRDVTVYVLLLDESMDAIMFGIIQRKANQTSYIIHGYGRELDYEMVRF